MLIAAFDLGLDVQEWMGGKHTREVTVDADEDVLQSSQLVLLGVRAKVLQKEGEVRQERAHRSQENRDEEMQEI